MKKTEPLLTPSETQLVVRTILDVAKDLRETRQYGGPASFYGQYGKRFRSFEEAIFTMEELYRIANKLEKPIRIDIDKSMKFEAYDDKPRKRKTVKGRNTKVARRTKV